ncbi:restriction endonuclease subunit S [Cellulomonas sp. HD19AZ1]|uniref:restriction endonuclease subunit S n=1 Tax=Cellulomonas sp. HD19AZ1 TaxID=2559593 RepID=UPI001070B4BB|nr:restriction endonuclease subunit S [Cellulomonas sp. HD19AZ1]TFH72160.1 restriction endonuclease subunit S [Cellulomonas sp. HD19AZ1]
MKSVGDWLELTYGKALKAADRDGGSVPVVGSGGVVGGHSSGLTSGPTIVVGRKGSIGSITWIDGPAWPIDTAYFVTPRRSDLDLRWAFWMLQSLGMSSMNKSAAVPGLNRDDVYRLPVDAPPIEEQRRIAAILDQADAIRTKRRQVLAHLDTLERSVFDAMFISDAAGDYISLKHAIKWSSGKFLPASKQAGGPFAVYGGNGVAGGHDAYMFEDSRLVVGRVGAYCGAVHLTEPMSWVTDNALIGTLLVDDLSVEYLLPALAAANLNQYAATSGQPSISASRIGDVRIPRPPVALQNCFAERVRSIQKSRSVAARALAFDDELFASLQSRAFRGEL